MNSLSRMLRAAVLLLGVAWFAAPVWAQDYLYTVRPGDTLWSLSDKYLKRGVAYTRRLQELNQVDDPEFLQAGSKLRFPIRWLKIQPAPAKVVSVFGAATASLASGGAQQQLKVGQALSVGDTIVTGPDGNVGLEFADGSRMHVRASSKLTFDSLSAYGDTGMADTRARLQKGRVDAEVVPAKGPGTRYEIQTPAAVSAVRGTDYRVSAEADQPVARTEVLVGNVSVSASGVVRRVPAKFGVLAEKGKPPQRPRALLPQPDVSQLAGVFERVPVKFDWADLKGAQSYRVQVASTRQFERLFVDRTVSRSDADRINLEEDGDYFLRLRGVDEIGLEGLDVVHAFLLNARPEPPVVMQPLSDPPVRVPRPVFRWTEPEQAVAYKLQIASSDDFSAPFVDREIKGQSTFQPTEPLQPGTYYWRLATRDGGGEVGPYGDRQAFTYKPPPPSPQSEPPSVSDDALTFRWSADEEGHGFRIQIARDEDFEEVVVDAQVSEPTYELSEPQYGTYYMRLATVEADGYQGPYGSIQKVDVPNKDWWKSLLIWLAGAIIAL